MCRLEPEEGEHLQKPDFECYREMLEPLEPEVRDRADKILSHPGTEVEAEGGHLVGTELGTGNVGEMLKGVVGRFDHQ